MGVTFEPNSGYVGISLPNADSTAVGALQSSNSGQPASAAFDQFQGVVQDDANEMTQLSSKIKNLQSQGNLSADQQNELLSDVQQYEKATEKFKSDNAHLVQIAGADQSTPEAAEATAMGNAQAVLIQSAVAAISSAAHSGNISPSVASAIDTSNSSIIDQANAIQYNNVLQDEFGGQGGSLGATETITGTGVSSATQVGPFGLANVDPSAVSNLRSTNAGQPQGQAFASFVQVVQGDQGQLNALADKIGDAGVDSPAMAGLVQQYEKAAEKFVGDQAHLLQLASADGSAPEVVQARAYGSAGYSNMGQESLLAKAVAQKGSLSASDTSAVSTTANSINDQANALSKNNFAVS